MITDDAHKPGTHRNLQFILAIAVCAWLPLYLFAAEPARLVLGTATKGGGFQLFGQQLIAVVNTANSNITLEEHPTKGSTENLSLLATGQIDLGLVEGNAAHEALHSEDAALANLQVVAVMYPNPGMFVVRADSPYYTIEDLQGRSIAFGTKASGLRILARDVLDGLGLQPERDFRQVILEKAGDGPRMVLNNDVAALWGAGIGWPGFVAVAQSPQGARFIAPSTEQIQRIVQKHPHLKTMSVPAGTYPGQTRQIDSVGLWSVIMVRQDISADRVYALARAMHAGETELAKRLQQGTYTTANNTVANVPMDRLHLGTVRYYRELGLLK